MRRRAARAPWVLLIPILIVLVFAVLIPELRDVSPMSQNLRARQLPPWGFGGSTAHPLGTDKLGRDMLARIAIGTRSSVWVSALSATGAATIGTVAGLLAGVNVIGLDRALSVLTETMMAIPFVTLGLLVAATIGQSTATLIGLLVLTGWITHARIIRLQTWHELRSGYAEAASAMGASPGHIALHHVLPNVLSTAVVLLFQQMGSMVLWSATLTYLGIGQPIRTISLGGIVNEGQQLLYSAWWVSAAAGAGVVVVVVAFNLCADCLRAVLDVRS